MNLAGHDVSRPDSALPVSVPWKRQLDISSGWHLLWLAILCTVGFAIGYALFTQWSVRNGVKDASQSPECWKWAWEDGFYFSIATESTVGYGDLAPHGVSRILACLQVVAGLVIAGLTVSYLTNRPSGKLKVLIERIEGAWAEISVKENGYIISLIYIRFAQGLLRYDGMNFDETGVFLGIFEGSSEPTNWISGSQINFDYSNEEGDKSYFSAGKTELCFSFPRSAVPKLDGQNLTRYDSFTGVAHDRDHKNVDILMVGYRLNEEQSSQVLSTSVKAKAQSERSELAMAYFRRYQDTAISRSLKPSSS